MSTAMPHHHQCIYLEPSSTQQASNFRLLIRPKTRATSSWSQNSITETFSNWIPEMLHFRLRMLWKLDHLDLFWATANWPRWSKTSKGTTSSMSAPCRTWASILTQTRQSIHKWNPTLTNTATTALARAQRITRVWQSNIHRCRKCCTKVSWVTSIIKQWITNRKISTRKTAIRRTISNNTLCREHRLEKEKYHRNATNRSISFLRQFWSIDWSLNVGKKPGSHRLTWFSANFKVLLMRTRFDRIRKGSAQSCLSTVP